MKGRNGKKIPRSTWMPLLLLIYLVGMTACFAPRLIAGGEIARLVIVFLSEIFIIVLLRIFLQKQEKNS